MIDRFADRWVPNGPTDLPPDLAAKLDEALREVAVYRQERHDRRREAEDKTMRLLVLTQKDFGKYPLSMSEAQNLVPAWYKAFFEGGEAGAHWENELAKLEAKHASPEAEEKR